MNKSRNSRISDHQRRYEAAENTRRCGTGQPVIMHYDDDEDGDDDEKESWR